MKLSELRPCDKCGGKITPQFQVVRMSLARFKPDAVDQTLGMLQYFGRTSAALRIAEAMTAEPECVKIAGDEFPQLMSEFFLCMNCYLRPLCLAELAEKRAEQKEKANEPIADSQAEGEGPLA